MSAFILTTEGITGEPKSPSIIATRKNIDSPPPRAIASDLPNQFIDKLKSICIDRINKDVHLDALSSDPSVRMFEIDFLTNGIIHMLVDYFKGEIDLSLDKIGELSSKLLYKLATVQPED